MNGGKCSLKLCCLKARIAAFNRQLFEDRYCFSDAKHHSFHYNFVKHLITLAFQHSRLFHVSQRERPVYLYVLYLNFISIYWNHPKRGAAVCLSVCLCV